MPNNIHRVTSAYKKISSQNITFISKILKRKTFTLQSIDIATDYQSKEPISHKTKQTFKKRLGAYSNDSYISKGSSLYCNDVEHINIKRVLIYDKYIKQTSYQKQSLNQDLRDWKLLVTHRLHLIHVFKS